VVDEGSDNFYKRELYFLLQIGIFRDIMFL